MQPCTRGVGAKIVAALAGLVLTAGLTACGGGEARESANQGGTAQAGFPRTVQHDKGSTRIETKPERIAALDPSLVEAVLALDRPLVGGIGSYGDNRDFPSYLGDAVGGTEEVGPLEAPNLEAVAALEPDLIVSATVRHDALYDELSAIAPTVFVETTGPMWKDNITKLGEALGAETKADEALAAYEQRAAALGKAINEKASNPTISAIRFMGGPTRLLGNESFTGIVLDDMGLARPKAQDVDEFAVEIGEEQIRKADGDHVFVSTYEGGDQSRERFLRNPLWRQLNAVKAGNVHEVNDATWMLSVSLQGANFMMDDMAQIFEVDPMRR
ncbi:iron complex transport system substrate-binding protein [Saccharomonospora amisosensis]|uniref:Iron complex transport system substrate-binding protein n=1 Tax=Saccharomonospora amisosensis TaxID=1128677 RepID=A0A7X5UMU8_9PSEU|nr:iron-siderophore ABC transporter substrate-binding protein [Saccharomonospora amisosensis]NIJ10559.1 iron complex transport system substrate-binding protein [Saccharomonospora amisosensis]